MSTQTTTTRTATSQTPNGRARREAKQAKAKGALRATADATKDSDEPKPKASSQHDAPAPKQTAPKGPVLTEEERAEALALAHAELDRLVPALRPCGCGCGATTKGRFVPGHDAKLLSRLLAEAKAKVLARRAA